MWEHPSYPSLCSFPFWPGGRGEGERHHCRADTQLNESVCVCSFLGKALGERVCRFLYPWLGIGWKTSLHSGCSTQPLCACVSFSRRGDWGEARNHYFTRISSSTTAPTVTRLSSSCFLSMSGDGVEVIIAGRMLNSTKLCAYIIFLTR